jgi:hypothetical protein
MVPADAPSAALNQGCSIMSERHLFHLSVGMLADETSASKKLLAIFNPLFIVQRGFINPSRYQDHLQRRY